MKRYYHARHRLLKRVDLKEVARELKRKYKVAEVSLPNGDRQIWHDDKEAIRVVADTLQARLSPYTAFLYQKEPALFTERDVDLRKRIFELYPFGKKEPKFAIEP